MTTINDLPSDMFKQEILSQLPLQDLGRLKQVNKGWEQLINEAIQETGLVANTQELEQIIKVFSQHLPLLQSLGFCQGATTSKDISLREFCRTLRFSQPLHHFLQAAQWIAGAKAQKYELVPQYFGKKSLEVEESRFLQLPNHYVFTKNKIAQALRDLLEAKHPLLQRELFSNLPKALKCDPTVALAHLTKLTQFPEFTMFIQHLSSSQDENIQANWTTSQALRHLQMDLSETRYEFLKDSLEAIQDMFADPEISESLSQNLMFMTAAFLQSDWILHYAPDTIKEQLLASKKLLLAAIKKNPFLLRFTNALAQKDKDILLAVLTNTKLPSVKGSSRLFPIEPPATSPLRFADQSLKQDKELALLAVQRDGINGYQEVSEILQQDRDVGRALFENHPTTRLHAIRPELRNNQDFIRELMENPQFVRHCPMQDLPSEMRSNPAVLKAALMQLLPHVLLILFIASTGLLQAASQL